MSSGTVSKGCHAMGAPWGCGPETARQHCAKHGQLQPRTHNYYNTWTFVARRTIPEENVNEVKQHIQRGTHRPSLEKLWDSLSECEVWSRIIDELHDQTPPPIGISNDEVHAAEALDITDEERREITRKIQRIHCSTGHSSLSNLVKALELRSAHPKVIQIAREWKCPICEHRHRKDPRHFATLETIPQKWERLQVDMFTWMHPSTKEKHHVLILIDEATRFRMTRIATTGKGNKTTWDMIRRISKNSGSQFSDTQK